MKVRLTLPLPGIVNVLQAGAGAPAVGLLVLGRVAPPFRVTELVEAYVKLVGNTSEIERLSAALRFAAFETTIV